MHATQNECLPCSVTDHLKHLLFLIKLKFYSQMSFFLSNSLTCKISWLFIHNLHEWNDMYQTNKYLQHWTESLRVDYPILLSDKNELDRSWLISRTFLFVYLAVEKNQLSKLSTAQFLVLVA